MNVKTKQILKLFAVLCAFGSLHINADTSPAVGIEQIKRASALGASCSGFYDGVFALLYNLELARDTAKNQNEVAAKQAQLKKLWPEIGQLQAFRQGTAAMLMTDLFIAQINQNVVPEQALSLKNFSKHYVTSRKKSVEWQGGQEENRTFSQRLTQCENILAIVQRNKTIKPEQLEAAVVQRAAALNVDLAKLK